jgi:hypothetical protein
MNAPTRSWHEKPEETEWVARRNESQRDAFHVRVNESRCIMIPERVKERSFSPAIRAPATSSTMLTWRQRGEGKLGEDGEGRWETGQQRRKRKSRETGAR